MPFEPSLQEENAALQSEIKRLNLELKKISRELRVSKNFLDKVTKASEAKDMLGSALSIANARQKAYTDVLLENCPSIITLLDQDGRFVLSTKSLIEVIGIPNFDFIKNRTFEDVLSSFFTESDMQTFKNATKGILNKGVAICHFNAWVDFPGFNEPSFYSIELRQVGGGTSGITSIESGILVVMLDLTDFMREKQRAEAASTAKSDFLATMSHEIRTPMNAILGMSTALDRLNVDSEHKKYITDIRNASEQLLSIINDILDFSKIEAGKMEVVGVNFNITNMLDNLHSMFTILCKQKGLDMHFEKDDSLSEFIFGDENRIRQVLTNVLANAVKYTAEGSVYFSVSVVEQNLHFTIKDSGIGIKQEDIEKLFTPFEQLDKRKNRNIVGTGLGLAITYNLCRIMNGNISVESEYGSGSTFTISLPYVMALESDAEEVIEISDFVAPSARVLVVDDMKTNLAVAEVMLDIFEIVPDMVENGKDAIKLATTNKYDIIFMDHMMPEMDGIETTALLRNTNKYNKTVPIVALTANVIKGAKEMFLEGQMDDFLPKPIEFDTLKICLKKWLASTIIEEEQL